MNQRRPFQRGPFEGLPRVPHRGHRFFDLPARELVIDSAPFGRMTVSYRELGDGPPLLLVHGLMTTSYSWRYVIEELAREHRVIAPDLPGCGRSDKPLGPRYTPAALAAWLGELASALAIRGCDAVGNSMGGWLCMRAALDDPRLFARLVNIHSPGIADLRFDLLGAALSMPGARRLLGWWIQRAPLRWAHRNVHYHDESLKSLEEAHEYGDPLATPAGAQAFIKFLAETLSPAEQRAFAASLAARRFPIPLLLLYSRQDPLVRPAVGQALKRLVPEARLEWLDGTSHFAHVDTPELVVAAVRRFLGQVV